MRKHKCIIAPFSLHVYRDVEYRLELFDTREEEGFEGNSYDLASLDLEKKCLN